MSDDYSKVRRRNREVVDDAWIEAFLERSPACVIGTTDGERVFLNPNLFLYAAGTRQIFFHTAGQGRTKTNIASGSRVTLCVFEMGRLLPAELVTDYSTEYRSVVVFGVASIVADPAEVRRVFEWQMRKYFPHHQTGRDYVDFTAEEASRATVYRLDVERWSAKRNEEPEAFPGAFAYPWKG